MGRTIETIRPPHQRGAAFRPLLGLTVSMSLRLVIPWRVALQQRPPPLHQPVKILKQEWQFEKSNYSMASVTIENCRNRWVHARIPDYSLCLRVTLVALCEKVLNPHTHFKLWLTFSATPTYSGSPVRKPPRLGPN